jgi:hypothetical protein
MIHDERVMLGVIDALSPGGDGRGGKGDRGYGRSES